MRLKSKTSALFLIAAPLWAAFGQTTHSAAQIVRTSSHAEAAKAVLLADPAKSLDQARMAEADAAMLPQGQDRALADAQAKWLQSAALGGLHRSAEALSLARAALHDDGSRVASNPKLLGSLHLSAGYALVEMGQFEEALKEFQAAYSFFDKAFERRSQALVLQAIGSTYVGARDYAHALSYYGKSIQIFGGDPVIAMGAYYNIGRAYLDQNKPRQAIYQFERARELAAKLNAPSIQARALGELASAQLEVGDDVGAAQSVRQGLVIVAKGQVGDWAVNIYRAAAQQALKGGQLDSAARWINLAFDAVKGGKSTLILRDVERTAFEIYKARGDTRKALDHFEQFKKLDDQARATAASTSAALMAAQFDFANQRASIAQLQTREVQSEARITRSQRTILLILLLGTGIVTTLLLFGFISIRRSRDRVRAANEELSETNVELEQALSARTQFLATTSHEIRTPLNGILGMTQVLLADRDLDAGVKSRIELVHGAGETMRALVDDILDVAKMTTGELTLHPAEMNLHRLLRDTSQVWMSQAQSKGIAVALDVGDSPERIVEDEVRLRQIVFNLTSNAVKFTDRGEVRIDARVIADDVRGERLQVSIKDTGIGIPPDKLDEIFESFRQVDTGTTRRHGGTGLGLAICRSLAKAMTGDITVLSVLGVGATFTLDIPLTRVAAAIVSSAPEGTFESARLLLVEGNPLTQSILRAMLSPKVAAITVVGNVDEAGVAIEAGEADLLLLDGNTIGRSLDTAGSLARQLTAKGGRVVLLWPTPDAVVATGASDAGIDLLLSTPIAAPDLVSALAALYVKSPVQEEIAA